MQRKVNDSNYAVPYLAVIANEFDFGDPWVSQQYFGQGATWNDLAKRRHGFGSGRSGPGAEKGRKQAADDSRHFRTACFFSQRAAASGVIDQHTNLLGLAMKARWTIQFHAVWIT